MRWILSILIFLSLSTEAQVIRANAFYRPFAASCSFILDTYTGAAGAYSVARKLLSGYTGSAIRIRRSNDNSETDIGFVGCELDTASLKSFVGANSAYVTTFYDQSGSGRNLVQATAGLQPRIVNAGTIDRSGGKVSLFLSTSRRDYLEASFSGTSISSLSVFSVFEPSGGESFARVFSQLVSGVIETNGYIPIIRNSTTSTYGSWDGAAVVGGHTVSGRSLFSAIHDGSNINNALNGSSVSSSADSYSGSIIRFVVGGQPGGTGGDGRFNGYISEVLVWFSNQSSNRTAIRDDLNTYYSIY